MNQDDVRNFQESRGILFEDILNDIEVEVANMVHNQEISPDVANRFKDIVRHILNKSETELQGNESRFLK